MVKCRPLAHQWGCERFGLADPIVLQAIEVGEGLSLLAGMAELLHSLLLERFGLADPIVLQVIEVCVYRLTLPWLGLPKWQLWTCP